MKPAEAREVYVEACRRKRRTAETGEAESWIKQFALCDAVDLRTALEQWWADTTPGSDGQPRSKWFPEVSQLKPMVNAAERVRVSRSSADHDFVVFRCPVCMATRSGFPEDPERRRFCMNSNASGRCGTILEIYRRQTLEEYKK